MSFGAFATLLVAVAFVALLVRVLRPSRKSRYESYASIPFDDDANDRGVTHDE
jgi:cbb3-type cytochrome oxidase subunit 3